MKTRTSSLLAAVIAMTALISVNASAQGPDGGRRSGSHNGGARVENHSATRGNYNNGPAHNGNHGNGGPAINNNHGGNHRGPAHNNGNHYGDNRGPAHNNGYRPAPNNHINPSVGHGPGPAHHHDHYRPAPRPRDHYRRPIPPRYFNRSAAYYRRAHIFADCLAAAAANALLGAIVANIPPYYTEVIINGAIFYLADNILYRPVAIYGRPYFEIVSPYYY